MLGCNGPCDAIHVWKVRQYGLNMQKCECGEGSGWCAVLPLQIDLRKAATRLDSRRAAPEQR